MTKVRSIMRTDLKCLDKEATLKKAIDIFIKEPDGVIPILENGRFVGEIYQRDMLKLAVDPSIFVGERVLGPAGVKQIMEPYARKVRDLMMDHEFTISPDEEVKSAAEIMLRENVRSLPVEKDGRLVGFVSELEILRHLRKKM
jgi:CBS domain-containing protein